MTLRYFNFIPTYNNPKTIVDIVKRCLESSPNPLLVVDDGSTQDVKELLLKNLSQEHQKNLHLKRFSKNRGKGAALKYAIRWGVHNNFTHMLSVDGDGQFAPEDLKPLQETSEKFPWDYVLGERIFKDNVPESSIFGRRFSNMWVKLETGKTLGDTQTGFRAYPLFWVQNIQSYRNRFDFELELIVKGLWMGAEAQSLPIPVVYPQDRVSHFKKFKDNFRLTLLHTQLCTQRVFSLIFSVFKPSQKKSGWTGRQSKGAEWGTAFFKWLIFKIGLRFSYFILFFVAAFYFLFSFKTRAALKDYWRNLSPEIGCLTLHLKIYWHIYVYGQGLIDQFYVISSPQTQTQIYKNFGNLHFNSSILVSGHFGFWRLASFLFNKFFYNELSTIEYVDQEQNYDKKTYESASEILDQKISSAGAFQVYDIVQSQKIVASLVDRPVGNRFELVRFANRLMPVDTSIALSAGTLGAELAYFSLTKKSIEKFNFFSTKPQIRAKTKEPQTHYLWAKDFAEFMEETLRQHPYIWANFYTPWKVPPHFALPPEIRKKRPPKTTSLILKDKISFPDVSFS